MAAKGSRARIEEHCLRICRCVLNVADLRPTDEFVLAGCDSIKAVLIAAELEAEFGVELTMSTFYEMKNASDVARWLADALAESPMLGPARQ